LWSQNVPFQVVAYHPGGGGVAAEHLDGHGVAAWVGLAEAELSLDADVVNSGSRLKRACLARCPLAPPLVTKPGLMPLPCSRSCNERGDWATEISISRMASGSLPPDRPRARETAGVLPSISKGRFAACPRREFDASRRLADLRSAKRRLT
jgi:hypothetical protein